MIKLKYCLVICFLCLCIGICSIVVIIRNDYKNMPDLCMVFSEHKSSFSGRHDIKLLNVRSMRETDLKIKTETYGNFFISTSSEIVWIGDNKLYTYNPLTNRLRKSAILNLGVYFEGRELKISDLSVWSVSPDANRIAYLIPKGSRIDLFDKSSDGKAIKSLGSRSELHVFDLKMNKDSLITDKAFDWGQPEWSFDGRKLLYARPDSDDYFSQDYINNMSSRGKAVIENSIFVYDFDKGIDYKLCQGVDPQWSPDDNKIVFSVGNGKIGVFDLRDKSEMQFPVKGNIDSIDFKLAWSPDQKYVAYLSTPKYALIGALVRVLSGSWYERPSSLWLINLDNTKEWCLKTQNFGDIKFAPKSYRTLCDR